MQAVIRVLALPVVGSQPPSLGSVKEPAPADDDAYMTQPAVVSSTWHGEWQTAGPHRL